jgi:hypothetical protein
MSELIFMGQLRGRIVKDTWLYAYPIPEEILKDIENKIRALYPESEYDLIIGHYEFGTPKIPIRVTKK